MTKRRSTQPASAAIVRKAAILHASRTDLPRKFAQFKPLHTRGEQWCQLRGNVELRFDMGTFVHYTLVGRNRSDRLNLRHSLALSFAALPGIFIREVSWDVFIPFDVAIAFTFCGSK